MPAHVAVIMDGNGRWARQRPLPRQAGHRAGVRTARLIVEACARRGIGHADPVRVLQRELAPAAARSRAR
jgi:undecaprenyl diphosphate synthase